MVEDEGLRMVLVRVQRIESIRDPEGVLGKRIELVEERKIPRFRIQPASEEARMVQSVVQVLQQQLPVHVMQGGVNLPKIILFLTEQEYDQLGIKFDVNQVYEVELSNQTVKFGKSH
jgi:hypothetical protein